MKIINLTLYSFDELSPKIQKRIIERERWNVMRKCMDAYNPEYKNTMSCFENIFDINIRQWEVGYSGCNWGIDVTKYVDLGDNQVELETLSGKLLIRYLQKHIMPYLEQGKYYSKIVGGKYISRRSKITKEIDCPLTGCCYDMYFIDPLIEFMKSPSSSMTYQRLMETCVDSFFKEWQKEYRYWADDEDAIREELHNNQYEDRLYYDSGDVYNGPLNDVA